jgi:hypothetical protein
MNATNKPSQMSNPRNAGRKPSGKTKHQVTLMLSPKTSKWLLSQECKAAAVADLIEQLVEKNLDI